MKKVNVRWLVRKDMPEVMAIEQAVFRYPWASEDFAECLRQRDTIAMVAEHDCRTVGYMIYELGKSWVNVINFAVHPEFQRQGIGRQMADKLIAKLHPQRRTRITVEVSERNVEGQLFWKAVGFRCTAQLKDYYDYGGTQDCYLFCFRIPCPCEAVTQ